MSVTLALAAVFERRRSGGFCGHSWVNTRDLLGEVPPPTRGLSSGNVKRL
jgi:hypothetical protein